MNGPKRQMRYAMLAGTASLTSFAVLSVIYGSYAAIRTLPMLAMLPLCVYLQLRDRRFKCSPETMMNETPTVIGMMAVTLAAGGSLDTAARDVATNGPKNISRIFKEIVLDADCRVSPDIASSLNAKVSDLPKGLSHFKRAMQIVTTAFESGDEKEKTSMMKDAEGIVLEGLKSMGNTYSSRLNSPCMLIFGLGIMVPMMLVSLLPMLSIGGRFSVNSIDPGMITFIVLVLIPAVAGAVAVSIRGKNPFLGDEFGVGDMVYVIFFSAGVPVYLLMTSRGIDIYTSTVVSFIVSGIAGAFAILPRMSAERRRSKVEEALKDALFELGNRMTMGENFETSLIKVLSSRKDCGTIRVRMERELSLCRGDIEGAVRSVLSPVSHSIAGFYCDVSRSSRKDIRNAGRLASSIAHHIQDQNSVRKEIENKLKSMLDMMTGTAALFAPVILGMSVVMIGPISRITGTVFFDDIGIVLAIYLVELSLVIAVLSSNLMCRVRLIDVMGRFCMMMPVSLVVFHTCTMLTM